MRTTNESLPKHATRIVLRSKGVPPSFRLSFRPSGSLSEDPRRENTPTLTQSRLGREGGRKQNLLLHRRTQWSRSSPPPPCRVRRAATPFPPPGTRMLSMSRPSVLYRRRTCGSPSSEERRTASTRVTRSHPPSLVTRMGPSRIYRTLLFETNTLHFGPSPIPSTAKQGFAFFSAPEN